MQLIAEQSQLTLADKQMIVSSWFRQLRDDICAAFEEVEEVASKKHPSTSRFERKAWEREVGGDGGGGEMSLMYGDVFEKVGVNISTVYGSFSDDFKSEIRGAEIDGAFWASGISLVAHMRNPHIPAAHMNTRFICTSESWFGGGGDLTPMIPDASASKFFHAGLKKVCDKHNPDYYYEYKRMCDEYFYLPHRREPRGVGGIFYDNLDSGDWQADFAFTKDVGRGFKDIFIDIVKGRVDKNWDKLDRHEQLVRRGRYAEFNLLYDRGTRFGLRTGGNTEAILMSLPPEVRWP
jgi:coproporphyrinogen III oxidase